MDACELLSARRSNLAAFRWDVLRTLTAPSWRTSALGFVGVAGLTRALQCGRIATSLGAAAVLVVAPGSWWGPALAGACCVLQLIVQNRLVFGLDGADQMLLIVWAGLALSQISPAAGLTLIGGQALLAYYAAGVAKLAGAEWRSGSAAGLIVRTASHGSPAAAALLAVPPIGWLASWATIAFELLAPLLLLVGAAGALVFVAIAVSFHASVAWAMGLNNFVWAFAAALPALYFGAGQLSVMG